MNQEHFVEITRTVYTIRHNNGRRKWPKEIRRQMVKKLETFCGSDNDQ